MSRLWQRLMRLAEIGDTADGGVNRQALSDGEIEAWRLLLGWAAEAGLQPATDAAGNLFLTRPGRDSALPAILLGSHIDTQPTGGKFDGAFGVLAALEVATDVVDPARDITVVAWMNEEGSRFAPGMMGSEFFAGTRDLPSIRAARDADGVSVGEALDALHAAFHALPHRPPARPGFYIEPHIEQGPVLERAGLPIGIVTGIQGKITWEMMIEGEQGHAGALAMAQRRDAVRAFSRISGAMFEAAEEAGPDVKFTIGRVEVVPNAPSVVPDLVTFRIDLRHPENDVLYGLAARLEALTSHAAPCDARFRRLSEAPSNPFDAALRGMIGASATRLGLGAMKLLSAAGHDARYLAPLCPSAMIFIPCRGGISHAPEEWAEPAHVDAGAAVLQAVVRDILSQG